MASTANAAVQYRRVMVDHIAAEFPTVSPLIASGVVNVDPNPPFKDQGGYIFDVPHVLEFTTADVVPDTDDTSGTRNALTTYKDVGIVTYRVNAIGVKDTASTLAGSDLFSEATRQLPSYWAKRLAIALYNVASGGFASAMDIAAARLNTGAVFARTSIPDLMKLTAVGDQFGKYSIWLMRSTQFADAFNDGIVNYVNAGSFGERLLQTGDIPTIAGRQVVVDDTIVDTDGTTFVCKPQAFYLGFQKDMGIEIERRPDLGGGLTAAWLTCAFLPHLAGLTFAGTATAYPTNTTLATGASWTLSQSTDYKLLKAVKVKFENV